MATVLAKSFGWTYSQSIRLISQACMSSKSQFIGRKMKKKVQNQKKRYLNRINSLDPNHDLDMLGKY